MSIKELNRLEIVKKCTKKELSQSNGAKQLNITTRHLRRLIKGFRVNGVESLISKHRSK